ncbi:MAG TPA: SagB/ThcOx family dehydrogenase [Syntrophales bacterium]|nr:SagB/ThcOx family dehydrogenase [Syntrophales bacterium]
MTASERKSFIVRSIVAIILASVTVIPVMSMNTVVAQDQKSIQLPKPEITGNPLMEIIAKRNSSRQFSSEPLPENVLSNMLWAAFGINRPDTGKRTAPSAMNRQEIDVYVATAKGIYLYEARLHSLKLIAAGDLRALTGKQDFVKNAAVNLIYVADYSKMSGPTEQAKALYTAADTGFISENVYLYCASAGLATVVRAYIDVPTLSVAMKLKDDQKIILAQSVGYPKRGR